MKHGLWTKNYTLLMAASALGAIGGIAGQFALSFLVFDETGSTFAAAMILAVQMIPGFLIPTFFAPWMDRFPRKPFLVAGDGINGLLYAAMGVWLLFKPFTYGGYLVLSLLMSCLGSFDSLAYNSIFPNLIPKGMEEKGYAVSSTLYPVLNVLMMPVAAVLMDTIGVAWILIGQGALAVMAALLESRIDLKEQRRLEGSSYTLRQWAEDLADGFRYLKKEGGLLGIYGYTSVSNGVAQGYGPLMIAFFRTTPGFTSVMYAMFSVAGFLGRTLGGVFCYRMKLKPKQKFWFAFGVYQTYDLMDMCLLWMPYPLMLVNRCVCGFLGINSATMRQAAVQKYIPDAYRARVNAFENTVILALGSLFSLIVGAAAERMDLRLCMTMFAGAVLAVSWLTIWRKRKQIQQIYES